MGRWVEWVQLKMGVTRRPKTIGFYDTPGKREENKRKKLPLMESNTAPGSRDDRSHRRPLKVVFNVPTVASNNPCRALETGQRLSLTLPPPHPFRHIPHPFALDSPHDIVDIHSLRP